MINNENYFGTQFQNHNWKRIWGCWVCLMQFETPSASQYSTGVAPGSPQPSPTLILLHCQH